MSKTIDDLTTQLNKTLKDINSGTVNLYQITEVFNDHIDRIIQLERRVAVLENSVKNQLIDTMPGAVQDCFIYK